jgi:AP endonuclease-2
LSSTTVDLQNEYTDLPPPLSPPHTLATTNSTSYLAKSRQDTDPPDPERDAAIAAALAASEAEEEASRAAKKAEQAPIWNNLFAKKAAPLCTVHGKPCKVFTSKVVGPNKNKRFWLCSL